MDFTDLSTSTVNAIKRGTEDAECNHINTQKGLEGENKSNEKSGTFRIFSFEKKIL